MNDRGMDLRGYAQQFRTQGNRDGRYWFLGIEEGGGATVEEIDAMLERWNANGRREIGCLRDPDQPPTSCGWFDTSRRGGPAIQTTWGAQIRVLLSYQGEISDSEMVRAYQASRFGIPNGESCLMELLPLPNPRLNRWLYDTLVPDPEFRSRSAFIDARLHDRIDRLVELIERHQPDFVVGFCYGFRHHLETRLENAEDVRAAEGKRPGKALVGSLGDTVVAITYHPSYPFSARNAWYAELGGLVRERRSRFEAERQPRAA